MTIERPMFPPRAESNDSFSLQPAALHGAAGSPLSDSPSPVQGLSRRAALAGLAILPVALPAAAASADPIFALIEAKRAADVAHLEAIAAFSEAERRYGVGSEEAEAVYDAGDGPCHAAFDTAWALASTPPTTLAGVLAMLRFVNEIDDEGNWPEDMGLDDLLLETTASAIEAIIQRGQA